MTEIDYYYVLQFFLRFTNHTLALSSTSSSSEKRRDDKLPDNHTSSRDAFNPEADENLTCDRLIITKGYNLEGCCMASAGIRMSSNIPIETEIKTSRITPHYPLLTQICKIHQTQFDLSLPPLCLLYSKNIIINMFTDSFTHPLFITCFYI